MEADDTVEMTIIDLKTLMEESIKDQYNEIYNKEYYEFWDDPCWKGQ